MRYRSLLVWAIACLAIAAFQEPLAAQYFGRNKVQYDHLQFRVLETPHFRIHYYPIAEDAVQDAARMAERWYERHARLFQHDFEEAKPVILYADHPDFQQTNTLDGFIPEGTGGVTESLKDRVVMPLASSYSATDHVLGHELVHAFQFNLAKAQTGDRGRSTGGGVPGFIALPLWLVEGMAEYLSVGREDAHTAMWMRDALLRDDFPTITQMSRESRFFPYRFGQALWAYIGGTYGDEAVLDLFRRSLRMGFEPAVEALFQITPDTLSAEWARAVQTAYGPLMGDRLDPAQVGKLLLAPSTGSGTLNVAPVLSPDGNRIAFLSEKDLFAIDLFLADAHTGEVIRKLSSTTSDTHFDALAYTETAGSFSPDGSRFVFVVFGGGDNELTIVGADGDVERRVTLPGIGSVEGPAWSPDGRSIAFSGTVGGISDLFVYDVETREVRQLTRDRHADFHPAWSPDGRTIAFASDRGPQTDFERLAFSEPRIALLDVATHEVRVLDLFGDVRHSNPQFTPDGESLYFLSDQDGFSDVYRVRLASREIDRVTRLKTGVSGITSRSPALSVATVSGDLAFSVFSEFEFHVYTLPASPAGSPVPRVADAGVASGRLLPPHEPYEKSRVAAYLADPELGLQPASAFPVSGAQPYRAALGLDRIGQPYFGAASDAYGYAVEAGASAFFSDMLGNRFLAMAVQQTGTVKDIGGQAVYADFSRRWNWALQGGRVPARSSFQHIAMSAEGDPYLGVLLVRSVETGAVAQVAYPLSVSRRLEAGAGLLRYSFDLEEERYFLDSSMLFFDGRRTRTTIDVPCEDLSEEDRLTTFCVPDPLNMAQLTLAYVGDNSFFGFTSPIRGGRFRLGMEATMGSENFLSLLADWRRYYSPHQNLTFAVRGLHVGRYGPISSDVIRPMYLYEPYVRGYALESFEPDECNLGRQNENSPICPTFNRLMGHRLAVANAELRVPLLGVEQYGLIDFPYIPMELVAFFDGGLAWDSENRPQLEWSNSSVDRVPVFSAGFGARFNVLGAIILEVYRAVPFQRPIKGTHWGFLMSPGW